MTGLMKGLAGRESAYTCDTTSDVPGERHYLAPGPALGAGCFMMFSE
jgi:hypothetical protein